MFTGTLYTTQASAANMLCAKKSVLLGWEQGLGKTVISIAAVEKLLELEYIKSVLVIAPSHLTYQWEDKINEFSTSNSKVITAKDKSGREYVLDERIPYTITSYALFRRDYEKIKERNWDCIICDEAQEFKNNKSKTAKLIKKLNVEINPSYRWALTGTAISNKLEELYSIFYWVDSGFLPSWPQFEKAHIVRNHYTNQIENYKNLEELSKHLKKKMHRRTQEDLKGQLPELVEQTLYLDKTKDYKEKENALLNALTEYAERVREIILTDGDLFRVPRDSNVSRAFHGVRGNTAFACKRDHCVRLVTELLEENDKNRVVVFSFYKEPLYDLKDIFQEKAVLYTGDHGDKEKAAAIHSFKECKERVLLSSDAGSTGLDLPFANYVIHLDIPFSHGKLDQRNKRITRVGSSFKTSTVIYLLLRNSLEQFFFDIVKKKKDLADATYYGDHDKVKIKTISLRKYLDEARRSD